MTVIKKLLKICFDFIHLSENCFPLHRSTQRESIRETMGGCCSSDANLHEDNFDNISGGKNNVDKKTGKKGEEKTEEEPVGENVQLKRGLKQMMVVLSRVPLLGKYKKDNTRPLFLIVCVILLPSSGHSCSCFVLWCCATVLTESKNHRLCTFSSEQLYVCVWCVRPYPFVRVKIKFGCIAYACSCWYLYLFLYFILAFAR